MNAQFDPEYHPPLAFILPVFSMQIVSCPCCEDKELVISIGFLWWSAHLLISV